MILETMKPEVTGQTGRGRKLLWAAFLIPIIGCVAVMLLQPTPRRIEPADARTRQVSSAGDALVWTILGVLGLVGAGTGMVAWQLAKRSRNPDPTLVFLDEILYPEKRTTPSEATARPPNEADASSKAQWERNPEWWKSQS